MSSRLSMSTDQSGRRDSISSYASMVYRRLSFEDDLFTARVYKRNYRSPRWQRLWKQKPNSDNETITSRGKQNSVVGAGLTITRSSSNGASSEAGPADIDPIMGSQTSDIDTQDDNQGTENPLVKISRATTTGGLEMASHEMPHVCPIHSPFLKDIRFMERFLQNGGLEYHDDRVLSKLMYCAKGVRWLPLHVFVATGDLPVVQLLLEKGWWGVSVNAEMEYGIQAIHLAARNGSLDVLAALIEAGADVKCEDQDGYQPLHYLSESRDKPDVIRYLAGKGAEVNTNIPTPLYLACRNDFIGILEALTSLGAHEGVATSLQKEVIFDAH